METRVEKWGNSLALRIPKALASEAGLEEDSPVRVALVEGRLIIDLLVKPRLSLDELLAAVTPENLREEVATGSAVGEEVW